ncbi:cation:proton antiporter [Inhella gelatinilytica]|uniref:Cation:proton antiporter n=1 Tax=Inhella gelatinilytica TaxID=2795030 RepID=A0A931IVM4_9BURK|nr:cation:proton antiporter [Inhella gelatinilytica]MBH9551488.1 cation:proton antiporter [Inhella gelatinilytica]
MNDALPLVLQVLPGAWPASNPLIVFGLLLAFGVLGGTLAARIRWLPSITAFMALGLLIGPSGIGLLSKEALLNSRILVDIALGLILFRLGGSLHPQRTLKNRRLVVTSVVESLATAIAIGSLLMLFGAGAGVAVLAASMAVSSSPAVLVHVAEELHARGTIVEGAKALVAGNNLLSFVFFSLALPVALLGAQFDVVGAWALPAYQLLGAVLVAAVVSVLVTQIARLTRSADSHYRFALVVGAVTLALGLAKALEVSGLFAGLCLGIGCRWLQGRTRLTRIEFGGGGDVFFVILFVFAGAKINLMQVWEVLPLAMAFVATRTAVKFVTVYLASRAYGVSHRSATGQGLLLVPMAGLAIGLVQTSTGLMPEYAGPVAAIVLASVAIFETLGPPVAAFALRYGGAVPVKES